MINNRRSLLKALGIGAIAIPLSSLIHQTAAVAAETSKLSLDDATAKALGYTHKSTVANKLCDGCQLYTGKANSEWGPCAIFSGKLVNAKGYCSSWNAKA